MSADYEWQLVRRAEELTDTSDLAAAVVAVLASARSARLDPEALSGLVFAALTLGAGQLAVYTAGSTGEPAYASDKLFLAAVSDVADDLISLGKDARSLQRDTRSARDRAQEALTAARRDLIRARNKPVRVPCRGCHGARDRAIAAAEHKVRDAGQRLQLAEAVLRGLRKLLDRAERTWQAVSRVPADLGETYEAVYRLLRAGGVMPHDSDWITGEKPRAAPVPAP